MLRPRILLIDIETAPIVAHVWQTRLWNTSVGLSQILEDTFILAFAAKWLGEKEIFYEDQSTKKNLKNDKALLQTVAKLLDEADIVIVQNGVAFDIPTLKARMASQRVAAPSPFKVVDTCSLAKKTFNFTSNRLSFLAKALGCRSRKNEHKRFPGMKLWQECLNKNPDAWDEMQHYNIMDVRVLEEVYLKMRPWIDKHPNVGIYMDAKSPVCPKCGSKHVEKRGYSYTEAGVYNKFHCLKCGGYSRGKQTVNSREHRRNQLVN
jgi:hypothetical protein